MLKARVPNVELHIYGNGVHGNGLKARDGAPFGTWQDRFIDWFRDLGFLGKAGVETKATQDVVAHVAAPTSTKQTDRSGLSGAEPTHRPAPGL
jgi:endo-1,4-beta-xylanase